ncbi:hypothetical protein KAH81_09055 [bacterium]|nr:hypothetical protein [bacterium]
MQILLENGRVIIELTPNEFSAFSAMFQYEGKALELVRTPFMPGKRHGWLNIG